MILSRTTGGDELKRKEKARRNLLTPEELEALFNETRRDLLKIKRDMTEGKHKNYTKAAIMNVRNLLILMGTIRLGRRSKEFTTMTVTDATQAEKVPIDSENFFFVKVGEQKTLQSTGEAATIPYEEKEYEVLLKFIEDLRPTLVSDKFSQSVFPSLVEGK